MEFKEIQDILKLVNRTNLTEVEIENGDFKIKIKRKAPESNVIYTQQAPVMQAAQMPVAQPVAAAPAVKVQENPKAVAPPAAKEEPAVASNHVEFKSPMIGTFYRAPNPETPPFAKVGDKVTKGQVLCIIEAMKLFNEIESEYSGTIVKILVEDSQPVEYDQPLFLIEPDA